MRVFLSWSGAYSREIANVFAEWIPNVLQAVQVFISTKDISAGERWGTKISGALDDIDFGLIFVTEENKAAPWLQFEAGALAKKVAISRVIPIMCDAKDDLEFKKNPLSHFQHVQLDKVGLLGAMRSMFEVCSESLLSESAFERGLEIWWPVLENRLSEIPEPPEGEVQKNDRTPDRLDRIEETLSSLVYEIRKNKQNNTQLDLSAALIRNAQARNRISEVFTENISEYLKNGDDENTRNYLNILAEKIYDDRKAKNISKDNKK